VDIRGLDFIEAVRLLSDRSGFLPDCLKALGKGERKPVDRKAAERPIDTPLPPLPVLPLARQVRAVEGFLEALLDMVPTAGEEGDAYLASRGCLPPGMSGLAFMLPSQACGPLAARLSKGRLASDMLKAGILKDGQFGKPPRLAWWGNVCLLPCHTRQGAAAYLIGRRLDWQPGDGFGKYINQPCYTGAARIPYGLPMLATATGRPADGREWPGAGYGGDFLLVEGALNALGAAALGWPALALLTRLQVHDHLDRHGAAAKALEPLLPALLDCRRVLVVPDSDAGLKGEEGQALAFKLVAWLRERGCQSSIASVESLGLTGSASLEVKDIADAAAIAASKARQI